MLLVLLTTVSFAQQITINVETAGTLSSLIAESKKDVITDLKLTGQINTTDVGFIKKMRSLENLDIKDVSFYDSWGNLGNITGFEQNYDVFPVKHLILPVGAIKIDDRAFYGCHNLETITLFDGIKEIGDDAFYYCSALEALDLPNSLETIGKRAFQNCESLKSIIIPNSVTSIKNDDASWYMRKGTFEYCTSLESIVLSENVTSIPNKFVFDCNSLQSIVFPDEVTTIGDRAIACKNLKKIVIGKKVKSMDTTGCDNIETVVFRCQNIGSSWFHWNKTIKNVIFEETVQSIDKGSFADCTNLESIHIPSSISSIGKNAFEGCTGLREITVDENNPNYSALNNALFNKDQTTLITFANSSSENFIVPETVTNIEEYVFYNCSNLNSLTISASVTEIGDNALYNCKKLEKIYCYATTPPAVQTYTFYNVDKWLCTLYVPVGSYFAYWLAPGWGDFINIEEYDPTGIQTVTDSANEGVRYYSVDGRELTSPQAGINLVKYSNGTIRKIFK